MTREQRKTVVMFGDSITAGHWPALVAERLQASTTHRNIRVVNAGVGGNTSREGLARINQDVLAHKPDVVTVEFGGNDATDQPDRHVDLKEFETNVAVIVEKILAVSPHAVVVMMTFPTVIDSRHVKGSLAGSLDKYVEHYRQSVRRFAKDRELPLVDMDAVIRPQGDTFIQGDGVHLTAEGNEAIARATVPVIRRALFDDEFYDG